MSIVVIGAVFVDIKGFPVESYIPDGRNAGYIRYIHGGVSRNVCENIANVELRPTFLSLVDNTALGKEVVTRLRNHKVRTHYIQEIEQGMGTWMAVFDESGNLAGSISQRPNLMPIYDVLVEHGDKIVSECTSIVLEADIDRKIVKRVFELAKKYNKKVFSIVSNMSIAIQRRDFIKEFDCFVCNDIEAGQLFGDDFVNHDDIDGLMKLLNKRAQAAGLKAIVVTLGSEGSIYANNQGEVGFVPSRKVPVKDTTGAGDAFCSGLAVGLSYDKSLKESCEIGTFLASQVITSTDNVIPRFLPRELGIEVDVEK